ncbi:MAG: hypothetical protein CMI31_10495 [Opitutae bacterium]|nr:hypothetical protein [Opitutae bacterium]|tara:strand:+ start:863 stop:3040 length:2178 start_codon:yes stop_codon:yes gene_type:complete
MTGKLLSSLILAGATGSALAAGFSLEDGGGFLLTAAIFGLLSGHLTTAHLALLERTGRKSKTKKGKGLALGNVILGYAFLFGWLATAAMSLFQDEPPTVTITSPSEKVRKPSYHELMIKLDVTDDNGVENAKLVVSKDGKEANLPMDVDSAAKKKIAQLSCVLPLSKMKLEIGDVVTYYVVVDDGVQEAKSEQFQVEIVDESDVAMDDVPDSESRQIASGGERAKLGDVGTGESGDVRKGGSNENDQNALHEDQLINDQLAGAAQGEGDITNVASKPLEEQDESGQALIGDNLDEDSGAPVFQREGSGEENIDLASEGFVLTPRRDKFSIDQSLFEAEEVQELDRPEARDTEIKRTLAKLNTMGVSVPKSMSGRCDKIGRRSRLAEGGGGVGVETAVLKGLDWLKATQNEDGSWGKKHIGAMTGLALLCFLGHCELTDSSEYGDAVSRGAKWLVEKGDKQNGWLYHNNHRHGAAYAHGIATYGLAEAFSMTEKEWMLPVLTKSVAHIVNGQKSDGGWFYLENVRKANGKTELDFKRNDAEGSDTSVSGWQFQALKAAYNSGAEFPGVKESLTESIKNFYRVYSPTNGGFGYRKRSDAKNAKHKLTGVGALGLQGWKFGHDGQDRNLVVNKACQHILKSSRFRYDSKESNLYSWYYDTQALFNKGGSYWAKWNEQMQPQLIRAQNPDGSFKEEGSGTTKSRASEDAKVYRTTLCLLMLEVYYRYVY